jgi:fumarate reductase flavoprotein subunit
MNSKDRECHTENDLKADVVVVGAGGAGLAAAVEASGSGADTVVLEKQTTILDSSTGLSAGTFCFAGTDAQKKEGIQDTNKILFKDIMDAGLWKNDPLLVQTYVNNQLDTYHWLSELGLKWGSISAAAGMSVPRGHFTDPIECIEKLKKAAEINGTRIFFNTPVTGLLTDDKKRVIGCRFEKNQKTAVAAARRGVVLATGGFGRDPKRLANINPRFKNVSVTAGLGHTGDGLKWAEALGATMTDMEYVKPSFELHVLGKSSKEILLMFYLGAIIINKKGMRFINESISYKDIGVACLDQPDAVAFQVFDQKIYDRGAESARKAGASIPVENFTLGLDEGRIKLLLCGNTMDELAQKIGVPQDALHNTITKYNDSVMQSRDLEFGRTALSGSVGSLLRIDTPPFYAYETKSHFLATYAGIAVDDEMRVLTSDGRIPGLYAAGEIMGGFHGASYHTGTALSKAIIFGRIAGKNASQAH